MQLNGNSTIMARSIGELIKMSCVQYITKKDICRLHLFDNCNLRFVCFSWQTCFVVHGLFKECQKFLQWFLLFRFLPVMINGVILAIVETEHAFQTCLQVLGFRGLNLAQQLDLSVHTPAALKVLHKKTEVSSYISFEYFLVVETVHCYTPGAQWWGLTEGLPVFLSLTLPLVVHLADCLFYWGFIN